MVLREQPALLSIDEFIEQYNTAPFELIDGERIPIVLTVSLHMVIVHLLYHLLYDFCRKTKQGKVWIEGTFVLTDETVWVKGSRTPDISFYSTANWQRFHAKQTGNAGKPVTIVPELVIEVVSKNDYYAEIQRKVDVYLKDGVTLIWIVDLGRETVRVYEGKTYSTLSAEDVLTGSTLLPDFSVALEELFAEARAEVGEEK